MADMTKLINLQGLKDFKDANDAANASTYLAQSDEMTEAEVQTLWDSVTV